MTMPSSSALAAATPAHCRRQNSSEDSSSTSCQAASSRFATSDSWPRATSTRSWNALACSPVPAAADTAGEEDGDHDDGEDVPSVRPIDPDLPWPALLLALTGQDVLLCPRCQQRTIVRQILPPARAPPSARSAP